MARIVNPYGEYRTNLYTQAMGCVAGPGAKNVFSDRIPLAAVRERFAREACETYPLSYSVPATDADGVNADGTLHYGDDVQVLTNLSARVRLSDGRVHGTFGAESGATRRAYSFLWEDYLSGITGEGPGDLHIVAAGTTRNGERGYLQIATDSVCGWEGFQFRPYLMAFMSQGGSLGIGSALGTQILSCANMVAGIASSGVKSKQTSRATDSLIIDRARIMLGLEKISELQTDAFTGLHDTLFTDQHWTALLDELAPVNVANASPAKETRNVNTRETLTGMWRTDPRCASEHGNALGAWQTLNTWASWERGTRGDTEPVVRMADDFLSGSLIKREESHLTTIHKVLAAV